MQTIFAFLYFVHSFVGMQVFNAAGNYFQRMKAIREMLQFFLRVLKLSPGETK
jgi:hypothetical protein